MTGRTARSRARALAGAAAVLVVTVLGSGPAAAAPATTASETGGVCGSTLTKYGHRLSCLKGSFYDRVRVGGIDDTFAIRSDRAVVYSGPYFTWRRVGTGHADDVKYVDATADRGIEGVCVETKAGALFYSAYDFHRGWLPYTAGCAMG